MLYAHSASENRLQILEIMLLRTIEGGDEYKEYIIKIVQSIKHLKTANDEIYNLDNKDLSLALLLNDYIDEDVMLVDEKNITLKDCEYLLKCIKNRNILSGNGTKFTVASSFCTAK